MEIHKDNGIWMHIFYISLIVLVCFVVYSNYLRVHDMPMLDPVTYYYPLLSVLKQSFTNYNDLIPLWNPYVMSGVPYFADPVSVSIYSLTGIMVFLLPNVAIAINLSWLLSVAFAGIFMYWLVFELTKNRSAGFISGVLFMVNGFIRAVMLGPGGTTINAYFFMPLVFLVVLRALRTKNWMFYSVLSGVLYGLMIMSGPDLKVASWFAFCLGFLFLTHIIGKNFLNRAVKVLIIGIVMILIVVGLNLQKILSTFEYLDSTNKVHLTQDMIRAEYTTLPNTLSFLVQSFNDYTFKIGYQGESRHIGLIAFILALYGIYVNRKNKVVLSLVFTSILIIFIVNGPLFSEILWKYIPLFKSFRHIYRAGIVFMFSMSVLAGFGVSSMLELPSIKKSYSTKLIAIAVVFVLIMLNLYVFSFSKVYEDTSNIDYNIAKNYVAQNMSKFPGIFRYHDYESFGIDWGTQFAYIPLNISNIYGYLTAWQPEYMNVYLSVANNAPAKFWGILNVKYLTSTQERNISGFRFVNKYMKCEDCYKTKDIQKVFGPYLYENEGFLPRAYFVENSILVVGNEEQKRQVIYSLMLEQGFKPYNTVIISGREMINHYSIDELKRYNAIFLTAGSIDQNSGFLLKSYVDSGGRLLPNIINGKNQVTNEELLELWDSFNGTLHQIPDEDYITHNFDKYELKLKGDYQGWIVLSEKFSMFPGWRAKSGNNEIALERADSVISTIYVDVDVESIIFEYKPSSYILGRNITILTIILLLGYFGFFVYRRYAQ